MTFYGAVVKAGKPTPFVPPPEDWALHLSQASLPASVKEGKRVSLLVKDQEGHEYIICTLKAGTTDSVPLDLFFSEYAEFSVHGDADVHITGYFSPSEMDGDDDEDGHPGMFGMDDVRP
jgi:FK506-binding nuclear protein